MKTCKPYKETDPVAIERRNRIRLSVAAYAYELEDDPIMPDAEFDALSDSIDTSIETGNVIMDEFFTKNFTPHTGMWIRQHPTLHGIRRIYYQHFQNRKR